MSNTALQLQTELFEVFRDLRSEKLPPRIAKEMNNAAGKIIAAAKAQLEYHGMRREKPSMKFFAKE